MLFLLASLAAAALPPARGAWVEFDRRPAGWAQSPYEYDSGSVRRIGARVRVIYRHMISLSGLPDPEFRIGIELDCAGRRTRIYQYLVDNGLPGPRLQRTRRRHQPTVAARIAPGSIEESLARHLCPATGPGEE